MENARKRKPFVAFLLSLLTPGLGQMYNGQLRRGIALYLGGLLLASILLLSGLGFTFYGMILCLGFALAFLLFVWLDAFIGAVKSKEVTLKPYNRWYLYLIGFLIICFVFQPLFSSLITNSIVRTYKIPSAGMEPALLVGDHFIANMTIHNKGKIKRGDVMVFEYPKDPTKEYVKRVIGLDGEKVEIVRNEIYINDKPLDDPWGHYEKSDLVRYFPAMERFGPVVVPKDAFFVLGDNRDNSQDSRFWGFVNIRQMKGKALYIYWATRKGRIGIEIK